MTGPEKLPGQAKERGGRTDAVAILIVDDDPKNLLALESVLESPDHRLVKAHSGDEALLALMDDDYAAIVLDVGLPDLNGIELARLIKQRKRTQHIPILFLTAHYRESEHAVLGYDVGAVDYITKPVHPAVLRSKVNVFVDLYRKTRALGEVNRSMELEIVDRKAAEERFRVVIEAAPSAMLVFSSGGEIVLVNSEAELLFAAVREELLGSRIRDWLPTEMLSALASGDPAPPPATSPNGSRESAVRRRDGTEVPAEIRVTPIESNEGTLFLASIIDITERKRAERKVLEANRELAEKNWALERQADERLRRIRAEAAQAEAEAANAAKDRFLAMLSHELRTPLSPVLHAVSLLDEERSCPPAVREALEIIRRNVQLEARLIDDLLDLARIRNGKVRLHLQPTDAHEALRHALAICQADVASRKLQVDVQLNAQRSVLRADPARLQQIFWNLISNAIKFTPENGSVTLATSNGQGEDEIRVDIIDSGAGIDSSRLAWIFDAFEQGTEERTGGLGLGLAICKALTESHGGTIAVQSPGPGAGSTFTITLPIADTPAIPHAGTHPPSAVTAYPLRLLLVEDHLDTATTLQRLLVRRGYQVQCADSCAAALALAADSTFDVIVTDVGLPDGSGVELFRQLKQAPGGESLHGIVLSGYGMDEDIARSHGAGFDDHLTKPVDISVLHRRLTQIGDGRAVVTAENR